MKPKILLVLAISVFSLAVAAAGPPPDAWKALRSLVGTWQGEGEGRPGPGGGQFSFALDLQEQIIVRKNHSEYPASQGRPATVHDDLLIAYPGDSAAAVRAIYFDNEGHVINYVVTASADGKTVTFLSVPQASAPRFRLSYTMQDGEEVLIKFEIAPPEKPVEFKIYIEGRAKRKI